MQDTIKFSNVKLSVNRLGAELKSVKVDKIEYMWNEEKIWAKTSPILFPFIGSLKDNRYIYGNLEYSMKKHGFARDEMFKLEYMDTKKLVYSLKYTKDTLKIYPFKFELKVEYEILGSNTIEIKLSVMNIDTKTMYYSIGYHPAFYCKNTKDALIETYKKTDIQSIELDGVFVTKNRRVIEKNSSTFKIDDKVFENIDTIILENLKNTALLSDDRKISLSYEDFLYTGYWRPKSAPFICIEPWQGVPNKESKLENIVAEKLEPMMKKEAKIIIKFEKIGDMKNNGKKRLL